MNHHHHDHHDDWLAERFQANRPHLQAVAYRLLGSASEADDAIQEAWLRLSHTNPDSIENLGGWLTTVVARICLDMLRARTARREDLLDTPGDLGTSVTPQDGEMADPEEQALLAEGVGLALLVVLETLGPAERLAFVLHDLFAVPFEQIAPIVGRTPTTTRQLASRARRRVQGTGDATLQADRARQQAVVEAFLAASRQGDFEALLALLDPQATARADRAAVEAGATGEVRGAAAVAEVFVGRARVARLALVDGLVGAIWAPGGRPRVVFGFTITDGRIAHIDILADPDHLDQLDLIPIDS
jgi:RNA polymerase sigma factor (sigma-70 family)